MPLILIEMIDSPDDREAVEIIYIQYRQLLFTIAMDILHDEKASEDAVVETFIRFIQNLDDTKKSCCKETRNYLAAIIRNYCYDIIKGKHEIEIEDLGNYMDQSVDINIDSVFEAASYDEIKATFHSLPQAYGDVLYLAYVEDKSYDDIALICHISKQTARKRLERAKKLFIKEHFTNE